MKKRKLLILLMAGVVSINSFSFSGIYAAEAGTNQQADISDIHESDEMVDSMVLGKRETLGEPETPPAPPVPEPPTELETTAPPTETPEPETPQITEAPTEPETPEPEAPEPETPEPETPEPETPEPETEAPGATGTEPETSKPEQQTEGTETVPEETETEASTEKETTGDFVVTGGVYGVDYTYDGTLHILTGTHLTISTNGKTASARIMGAQEGVTYRLTLKDFRAEAETEEALLYFTGHVELTLQGSNTVRTKGTALRAGSLTVTADSAGTLELNSREQAGICLDGRGSQSPNLEVNGGNVSYNNPAISGIIHTTGMGLINGESCPELSEAVKQVQELIDALPTAEELDALSPEEQQKVYEQVQAAWDAYEALTEEEQAQITGVEVFESLFGFFNGMTNTLAETRAENLMSISTVADLQAFAERVNNGETGLSAVLMNDLDMSGQTWTPIPSSGNSYNGEFDGGGHAIKNITVDKSDDCVGFFSKVNGTVHDLGITGSIKGREHVGGIVGWLRGGSIRSCWNGAAITGTGGNIGGIVGWTQPGSVSNCYNYGNVQGTYDAGGIIGTFWTGNMEYCYNSGTVTNGDVLVGYVYQGNVNKEKNYYIGTTSNYGTAKTDEQFKSGEVTWLLNGEKADGVWKQTLDGSTYPSFSGGTVYKLPDGSYSNQQPKAPAPSITESNIPKTASTLKVTGTFDTNTYGNVEYSWDGGAWTSNDTLSGLKANSSHTVSIRYAGKGSYQTSDASNVLNISTNNAAYTISIPSEATAGGTAVNINASQTDFDLGAGGKVDVKITNGITDGKLTLVSEDNPSNNITSALLVDGSPFTTMSDPVVTFNKDNYTSESAGIRFDTPEKPESGIIPAGKYNGTVTFTVSYSEQ